MFLNELFDQLTYGELSQLEYGGVDDEGITKEDHKRIIPHINLALTELHKRFLIREEEVTIRCYDHIETYVLDTKYAATNTDSTEKYKYIHDTIFEPFVDNVLKIEKVFNEDGQELFLNEADPYVIQTERGNVSRRSVSVHTPNYRTIQIPYPMKENALVVEYRANHEKVEVEGLDPNTQEIKIPTYLMEAFLLYIASRVYSSLGGDSAQEGMAYMAKFEASCKKIEELNLVNKANAVNQKLEVSGWV